MYGMKLTDSGPSSVKDVDAEQGVVVSYPSTFGVVDSGNERMLKGAFARTINSWGPNGKNRVKALFDHKPFHLIGRPTELREDDFGLLAVTKVSDTTLGRDVLTLIKDGVITEQSVGYSPVREEKNEEDGVLDIKEVKLYEYSFLAWGMNMETPILSAKNEEHNNRALLELKRDVELLESAMRKNDFFSEEIPSVLEYTLKQWKEWIRDIEESVVKHTEDLLVINKLDKEQVKSAINELTSLLGEDSADATPESKDSTDEAEDSLNKHSDALTALVSKMEAKVQSRSLEREAADLLRQFSRELGEV